MSAIGKTFKFTGGVLAGLGIGAVTALLLAPQSGNLTTEQLQARVSEILDAGRRAQRQTEDDLYSRWEAEMTDAEKGGKPEDPAEKARKAAEATHKKEEQARKDAEKHLEKAQDELSKARKSV